MTNQFYIRFVRLPIWTRILMMAAFMVVLFGSVIHIIEPNRFPTVFDGVWWAIVTASTVGYGDFYPVSAAGRVTAMILLLFGTGFLSSYFIHLSAATVTKQNAYMEGRVGYKGSDHMIIIGWNEKSRTIIQNLMKTESIILIDETLESHPIKADNVHFIKGRANKDETLWKARISTAKIVMITSDQNLDELQADMHTILTLLAIKGLNPDIRCIAEIQTSEQVNNARRAGADELIPANALTSAVLMNTISSVDAVSPLLDLLAELKSNHLAYIQVESFLHGKDFQVASSLLLKENNVILIGIKRGDDLIVNPPKNLSIKKEDQLLAISND
ncbi:MULTISPECIES: potassium channel family protein [Mesobacillus]|uniref:Ion transporter n=2 Tax=Mesobacillus TaxID=2675231 RepID=A0A0D6ZF68_9BACI|nr:MULTISPECIES: potassium channel family protein [Mesobacillus]KIY23915.1 ion transporter [Mesobacillus subterraneus]MDQ0412789.1 voltage-gated potassium channel [Mesobacillus stamsii]